MLVSQSRPLVIRSTSISLALPFPVLLSLHKKRSMLGRKVLLAVYIFLPTKLDSII